MQWSNLQKSVSKFMPKRFYKINPCGLYYKHMTIVNYASSIVNKLKALLTDDARVIIYDRHVFIVQATGLITSNSWNKIRLGISILDPKILNF